MRSVALVPMAFVVVAACAGASGEPSPAGARPPGAADRPTTVPPALPGSASEDDGRPGSTTSPSAQGGAATDAAARGVAAAPTASSGDIPPWLREASLEDIVLSGSFDGARWALSAGMERGNACHQVAFAHAKGGGGGSGSCFGKLPLDGGTQNFFGESGSWTAVTGIVSSAAVTVRAEGGSGPTTEAVLTPYLGEYGWRLFAVFVAATHRPERLVALDQTGRELATQRLPWEAYRQP